MVFKSNTCNQFRVGGLIFNSEEDYNNFKNLDKNIQETVKLVNDGIIDLKDVFNNVKTITVKECYYDAGEELDELFLNAAGLLIYEDTRFVNDYKVGCRFFDKINVIEYNVSDSDSDSDSESYTDKKLILSSYIQ